MSPLVRWTIGRCHDEGADALWVSITQWHRHFGDHCRYCVCYNADDPPQVPGYCQLVDQRMYSSALPLAPWGPAWKLYPPRLDLSAAEIMIDNDLVLYNPPVILERWMANPSFCLATEAYRRCYGQFDALVQDDISLNSGMIGLPPCFDFGERLLKSIELSGATTWATHFCEQGCVAHVLTGQMLRLIPLSDLPVGVPQEDFRYGSHGIHFVGLNSGFCGWWRHYLCVKLI